MGAAAERPACSTISVLAVWGIISPRVRSYVRVRLLEIKINRADIQTRICLSGGDVAFTNPSSLPADVVRVARLARAASWHRAASVLAAILYLFCVLRPHSGFNRN